MQHAFVYLENLKVTLFPTSGNYLEEEKKVQKKNLQWIDNTVSKLNEPSPFQKKIYFLVQTFQDYSMFVYAIVVPQRPPKIDK